MPSLETQPRSQEPVYRLSQKGQVIADVAESIWNRAKNKRQILSLAVFAAYFGRSVDLRLLGSSIIVQAEASDCGAFRGQVIALENEARYTVRVLAGDNHLNRNSRSTR